MSKYAERLNDLGYREVTPKPTENELREHYEKTYYQKPEGSYAAAYTPDELRHFKNVADVAKATFEKFSGRKNLLDLGCGEGFFAAAFQGYGWPVACCDYSDFGIRKWNPSLLETFSKGEIVEMIGAYKRRDEVSGLINLQNVLEHVLDPEELLRECRSLMDGKSVLRVEVPNDYSDFQMALIERGHTTNTWFRPPEHLSYFNAESLRRLFQKAGFRVLSLQANFPIEIFLANPHSNYAKDRSLGKGAHNARMFCDNHLIEQGALKYIAYTEAAAELGFGRELVVYAGVTM